MFEEEYVSIFQEPILQAVGEKYGKTAAQIALQYLVPGHRRHSEIVPSGADGGESRYFRRHPDTGRHGPDSAVRDGENPVWLV